MKAWPKITIAWAGTVLLGLVIFDALNNNLVANGIVWGAFFSLLGLGVGVIWISLTD